jgi:hypothetical protein
MILERGRRVSEKVMLQALSIKRVAPAERSAL